MPNRTPERDWGRLFNFAGGGIVHNELFALFLMSALNPTLFESIATILFPYGTHAARPTVTDTPLNSYYFETDTSKLFQNQADTWVQIASIGGGGAGVTIQVNGVDTSDQTVLNFLNTASVTWNNPADGDIEATATGGGGGGGLELVENKIFTAGATSYSFSGLDGDTDREYLMQGKIVAAGGGTPFYSTRFNSQATTYSIQRSTVTTTTANQNTFTEPYVLGADSATVGSFKTTIYAAKSVNSVAQRRMYLAESIATTSGVITWNSWRGWWTDTTNNITAIQLFCDTSNGIGDGSQVALYKYAQT